MQANYWIRRFFRAKNANNPAIIINNLFSSTISIDQSVSKKYWTHSIQGFFSEATAYTIQGF